MQIHFETLGCRLNHDETEGAARFFSVNGFSTDLETLTARSSLMDGCVLGVINTCTVTGKAEQKARRVIRLMLQKLPNALILVTGCYAEHDAQQIRSICEERVSVLSGTKKSILAKIATEMKSGELSVEKGLFTHSSLDSFIEKSDSSSHFTLYTPVFALHSRGSLKIQDGCNCSCTFCRIHIARGKSVSLDVYESIRRVKEMEKQGLNEVTLTGVNLSQYSSIDKEGKKVSFASLLSMMIENTASIKFRISSFYPQSINEELCKVISSDRVQPFFHISIQSGSDSILKAMARPHNTDQVVSAIEMIRKYKSNPFISCDIIAGFPGESEEDFAKTRDLCNKCNFAWIHSFPYSPRPGTLAQGMKGQIPERIKGERVKILTDIAVDGKCKYIEECIGTTHSAIVENSRAIRIGANAGDTLHLVTDNFLHVQVLSNGRTYNPGSVVNVKIVKCLKDNIKSGMEIECLGEIV